MAQVSPIKSSGAKLKDMLQKTGHSLKGLEMAEKLDLLQALAEQIKDKVEHGQKMLLTLPELNAFLRLEGLDSGKDAKGAITLLSELRRLQLERLGRYVGVKELSEELHWLVEIPGEKVSESFSMAMNESTSPQPQVNGDEMQQPSKKASVATGESFPAKSLRSLGEQDEVQQLPKESCPSLGTNVHHGSKKVSPVVEAPTPIADAPVAPPITSTSKTDESAADADEMMKDSDSCADNGQSGDAIMLPIQSSGNHLKVMLQKTGHSLKGLTGVEKLDILNVIAEQVKENIRVKKPMMLKLSELNAFLELEGLSRGQDAKKAVELLLELRQRQLLRLGSYASLARTGPKPAACDADDASFRLDLALIPTETVTDIFADAALTKAQSQTVSSPVDGSPVTNPVIKSHKRRRDDIGDTDGPTGEARPTSVPRLQPGENCGEEVAEQSLVANQQAVASDVDMGQSFPIGAGSGEKYEMRTFTGATAEDRLSPELRNLLLAEQVSTSETLLALEGLFDSDLSQEEQESAALPERHEEAMQEVERILATKDLGDVLGGGTLEEQRQEFQRIARLLHPDKGCVRGDHTRANNALRLAFVARKKTQGSSP